MVGVCAAMLMSSAKSAHAYSYESLISDGCHEGLAKDTLRAARATYPGVLGPSAMTPDDASLISEAPFTIERDLEDIEAFSFLAGIRDNDLKGHEPTDTTSLATVHGNPDGQREHCLRRSGNDEPNGTQEVITECRAWIEQLLDNAIDGGIDDATGMPDSSKRTRLAIFLAYSGEVDAELPIFYVYMGQALHAVEDSFTHMYRTGDHFETITVAGNWIDMVDGTYDERRDGPPHITAMDQCKNLDDYREARLGAARRASVDVFLAASNPSSSKDERKANVRTALDEWFGYQPGCTYDTRWCDAPENAYRPADGSGCSIGGGATPSAIVALLAGLAIFGAKRRRRAASIATTLVLFALPHVAHAQTKEAPVQPTTTFASHWSLQTSMAASIDHPGAVVGLGVRYALNDAWVLGGDVEWNPWMSLETKTAQNGTLDIYATAIRRFRINDTLYLRTTAHLGASVLLFSMYGAPAGTFGPYVGLSLLGLEVKTGAHTRFIFDPADVALPIPHLTGAPLSFHEYRMTLGFAFGG
jgi:hypothetical protein